VEAVLHACLALERLSFVPALRPALLEAGAAAVLESLAGAEDGEGEGEGGEESTANAARGCLLQLGCLRLPLDTSSKRRVQLVKWIVHARAELERTSDVPTEETVLEIKRATGAALVARYMHPIPPVSELGQERALVVPGGLSREPYHRFPDVVIDRGDYERAAELLRGELGDLEGGVTSHTFWSALLRFVQRRLGTRETGGHEWVPREDGYPQVTERWYAVAERACKGILQRREEGHEPLSHLLDDEEAVNTARGSLKLRNSATNVTAFLHVPGDCREHA
jgi:hypothetical protein